MTDGGDRCLVSEAVREADHASPHHPCLPPAINQMERNPLAFRPHFPDLIPPGFCLKKPTAPVCSSTSTAPPLPATDPRLRRANPARIPPPPDPAMDAGSRPPPPTGAGVRVRAPLVSPAPLPFPSWSSLGGAGVRVGLGGRCWGPKALSLGRKLRSFGAGIEGFGGSPRGWAVWI